MSGHHLLEFIHRPGRAICRQMMQGVVSLVSLGSSYHVDAKREDFRYRLVQSLASIGHAQPMPGDFQLCYHAFNRVFATSSPPGTRIPISIILLSIASAIISVLSFTMIYLSPNLASKRSPLPVPTLIALHQDMLSLDNCSARGQLGGTIGGNGVQHDSITESFFSRTASCVP